MYSKPRVLLVDDDPGILETMSDILSLEGHEIDVADCGEEAVRLCAREDYDFALLDIRMPGMDGVATLRKIKSMNPSMRVVMITGFDVGELASQAIAEGAEAVFRKPLDVASFLPLLLTSTRRRS